MAIFIPLVTKFDDKGLKGAQAALAGFQNFAVDVARVAAAAVAAVGVASVREAARFETTFSQIQGLVGLTTKEVEDLQVAARDIGKAYGVGANEAAEALFFITSAGLRGADATGVLEAAAKGAAIGLGDMNSIANAATAAMNTYGPSVLSGTEAVDALAEAVRLGQFAPEELASSLGRVIPVSAEMGVTIQETLGMIAGLTKGGLNASESVTGIRAAMNAFLKPTAEATKMLEEYGLSTEEVSESIKQDGFLATMISIRDAFGDNEQDFLRVIGSQEGLNAVLSLTGSQVATNLDIINQMTDGVGILDEAFAITADTTEFKFNKAMATAKDSLMEIGGALLENINPLLEDFALWFEENKEPIEQTFIAIFEAVDKVVGALIRLLDDKILPFMQDIFEDERFKTGVASIGAGFAVIATEANRFVESDVGKFLADLTKEGILNGLGTLGRQLENIGIFLGIINDTINLLQGKGGTTTADQLKQYGLDVLGTLMPGRTIAQEVFKAIMGTGGGSTPGTISYGGFGGGRAGGGPVSSSKSYLVGEMGPEIFTPAAGGGTITPNNQMGGAVYNITVNAGMGAGDGARLGEQIVSAIRRFERSSGPVFASA